MKKIKIEIPDGRRAEWVNGVLTLVNDTPKDVRDRVKTFEDACAELGDIHPFVQQYYYTASSYKGDPISEDLITYLRLRIIATALNEGWEPKFEKDERRWYPWFNIEQGNWVYATSFYAGSGSLSSVGVRLVFKSKELAEYAGKQFIDIYKDFCFKNQAKSNEQNLQASSNL